MSRQRGLPLLERGVAIAERRPLGRSGLRRSPRDVGGSIPDWGWRSVRVDGNRWFAALRLAVPQAQVFYAVKANPARPILERLHRLGSSFDVASPGEIVRCLGVGVDPARLSYGSTIKKQRDIAWAYERGVRLFAIDSEAELRKVGEPAAVRGPGASGADRGRPGGAAARQPGPAKAAKGPAGPVQKAAPKPATKRTKLIDDI